MGSDREKIYALQKKFEGACLNSAKAEARCADLREQLFMSEKHWYNSKDTFPQREKFRSENNAFVYGALSNGDWSWGDYTKIDFLSKSFDKEQFNQDETKCVWCYAWMYLPCIPRETDNVL